MKGLKIIGLIAFVLCFVLSGCIVRTYESTRDRVDQEISGNRGYLKGSAPSSMETPERKTTRTTRVVEIELHPPLKFEKVKKGTAEQIADPSSEKTEDSIYGNRGYITQSISPEIEESSAPSIEKYTVQKGDTLQKISQKFFGTTKKWHKIYEANKDSMKGPNKIYPGQVINIPDVK